VRLNIYAQFLKSQTLLRTFLNTCKNNTVMATLSFETLSFAQSGENVKITLLKLFETIVPLAELNAIGPFSIKDKHSIEFKDTYEHKAETKFSGLLNKYFENLKNKLTGNNVTYVHRNSGIPLIGNVAFGIIYRNSSIIEIKPVTSCNLDCIYCSISEGLSSKKHDFVVEMNYLLEELEKVIAFTKEKVEIHIGVQGEPFLYEDMILLIENLQKMEMINTISIDTNGTLLTKDRIDRLSQCNKLQFNMSLDAIDVDKAKEISGVKNYNLKHVLEMIRYTSEVGIKMIIAPVYVQGHNDDQLEKIIEFVKSLKNMPTLGIQNFLRYKTSRNPAKELPWKDFYAKLADLEAKNDIKLKLQKEDFNIHPIKELPLPFKEGDVIKATIKCPDRFSNSSIAVYKGRNISIANCPYRKDKRVKVKITRDKHNIFSGKLF
jgi:uncharacterized protein